MAKYWRSLSCTVEELRLDITLACGQSFRWCETSPGEWTSVLAGKVWTLKQDHKHLYYRVHETSKTASQGADEKRPEQECKAMHMKEKDKPACGVAPDAGDRNPEILMQGIMTAAGKAQPTAEQKDCDPKRKVWTGAEHGSLDDESIIQDYFQLGVSLQDLYAKWSEADSNFKTVASSFTGVRILRQCPVENLFSFICSSNNNISRIGSMVENMCRVFGEPLMTVDGGTWYCFPSISALAADGVEEKLRDLGFGYRARYVSATAKHLAQHHSAEWLLSLRLKSYEEAKAHLMKLTGVGAKVADCVCLMSLDKSAAIPVDTHVWQIACRDYMPALGNKNKSLTETVYRQIGDHFRDLWGDHAGWAHSVLFSSELKKFQQISAPKQTSVTTGGKRKLPRNRSSGAKKKH